MPLDSPSSHAAQSVSKICRRFYGLLTGARAGAGLRYLGVVLLALAVATSSLTFNWVIEHDAEANLFPEFAGRVVYLSDVLVFAGLVLWAMGWYSSASGPLRFGPWYLFAPLLLLVILTTLSIVWAGDGTQTGFTATRRFLLFGLYLVMVNEAMRASAPMAIALLGIGSLHAVVALAQVGLGSAVGLPILGELTQESYLYGNIGASRAYGLGFNPNPVGLFLAVGSVLAYSIFILGRGYRPSRAVMVVLFLVTLAGLMATGSRSALTGWFLGLLAVTVLAAIWHGDVRKTILKCFGVAVLLVFLTGTLYLLLPTGISSFGRTPLDVYGRFSSEKVLPGLKGRMEDIKLSLPVIRDNLPLGVGAGNYPLALKSMLNPGSTGGIYVPPHNVPILVLAELGIVGVVAWVAIMFAPLIWVLSHRKSSDTELLHLVWLGPLLVLLFESLWDFPPWATQDGRVLMLAILGLWAGGISAASTPSEDRTLSGPAVNSKEL